MKRLTLIGIMILVMLSACAVHPTEPESQPPAATEPPVETPAPDETTPAEGEETPESGRITPGGPAGGIFGPAIGAADMDEMLLIPPEQPGERAVLLISGSLPTPCHELIVSVNEPDEEGNINVTLLVNPPDPGLMCVQVIDEFAEEISLGELEPGSYNVLINGALLDTLVIE